PGDVPDIFRQPGMILGVDKRPDVLARREHDPAPRRRGQIDKIDRLELDTLARDGEVFAHRHGATLTSSTLTARQPLRLLVPASALSARTKPTAPSRSTYAIAPAKICGTSKPCFGCQGAQATAFCSRAARDGLTTGISRSLVQALPVAAAFPPADCEAL